MSDPSLAIARIYGTSSNSQRNFAASSNSIAYIASGGVVVCHIDRASGALTDQRFFCATSPSSAPQGNAQTNAYSYLNMMNQLPLGDDKDSFGLPKVAQTVVVEDASATSATQSMSELSLNSPGTKATGQRIKTISCIAISPDERLLAVGESGTQPRILLFSLAPDSNSYPFLSIAEHNFGVTALHFSPDSKHLLSIGDSHDGFIYLWRLAGTSVSIIGANKCTSQIHGILWTDDTIITYGVRNIKIWKFEEFEKKSMIQGKNVILGDFINGNFVYATPVTHNNGEDDILFLTSLGEICGYTYMKNALTLRYVHEGSAKVGAILSDLFSTKVWIATDDITELSPATLGDELTKENDGTLDSPSKAKFIAPITCMRQISENFLVYITSNEEIQLFDVEKKVSTHLIDSLSKSVNGVKKTSSGRVISWTKEGVLKCIDQETLELTHYATITIPEIPGKVIENHATAIDVTSDEEIVLGDAYGNLVIYNKESEQIFAVQAHEFTINDVSFFEIDSFQFIVTIGRDRMIQVFARLKSSEVQLDEITTEWSIYQTLADHRGNLLQLIQHNNRVYVSSADRSISVHKFCVDAGIVSIQKEKTISVKSSPTAVTVTEDELVVSTMDKQLLIFNLSTLESTRTLKLYNEESDSLLADNMVVTSPSHIVCSCSDKSIRVFNYINGRQLAVNWGHSEAIKFLLHTNQHLITLSSNGCLFSWNLSQGSLNSASKGTICKYTDLATPPRVTRKIKKPISQASTPARRQLNSSPQASAVKSPVVTRLQSTAKMTPTKLNNSVKTNLSPSPGSNVTPRASRSSSPRSSTFGNIGINSPTPASTKRSSILITNKTRLQDSQANILANAGKHGTLNNENKIKADDLIGQLKSFKENMDSYTQQEVALVKKEIKTVFNYEEELLSKYNVIVMDAMKKLIHKDDEL